LERQSNCVSILQWNREQGFYVDSFSGNSFRDRWGLIHARTLHRWFYDDQLLKPSRVGIEYLTPIFTGAIGHDDVEHIRQSLFHPGNLLRPYHSVNTDVNKRIRYLESLAGG
jgi:6-phosphofructokinase 1